MRQFAQQQGQWLLGEQVTVRMVEIYRKVFGSLDPLLDEPDVASLIAALERNGARGMAPADMARLQGTVINHLAANDSRRLGRRPLRASDWRVVLHSLSGARTLRDGIQRYIDCFEALDWRCGRTSLRARADMAEMRLDALRPERSIDGCLIDLSGMAHVHALCAWMIAQPLPLEGVWLDHDAPTFAALDLPQLPFPRALDEGWTGFRFPSAYLDYPVVRTTEEFEAGPPGSYMFGTMIGDEDGQPVSAQARRIVLSALRQSHRLPLFEELLPPIGGSATTLRRRLAEGISFREIKDSCRREISLDLLSRSSLSVEEIAERLDYCDSDAFRQWVGMPTSRYRAEAKTRPQ
jgi:AraC-like DNA-binding protein